MACKVATIPEAYYIQDPEYDEVDANDIERQMSLVEDSLISGKCIDLQKERVSSKKN